MLKAAKIIDDNMEVIGVTDVNMVKPAQIEVPSPSRSFTQRPLVSSAIARACLIDGGQPRNALMCKSNLGAVHSCVSVIPQQARAASVGRTLVTAALRRRAPPVDPPTPKQPLFHITQNGDGHVLARGIELATDANVFPTLQALAKTVWTGQNHFLVHSKQPVKISEATDRMLRMTAATDVSFVVSNLAEAKLLTREWMSKVCNPNQGDSWF